MGSRNRDRIAAAAVWGAAVAVTAAFALILWDIVLKGVPAVSLSFLTSEPDHSGRTGGIAPILVSTGMILLVCLSVSLPIGLGAAIFLSEYAPPSSRFGRIVRGSLDVLSGVPSIVMGLFGYAFFCQVLGMGFSILSGGFTLACMVLPILIRSTEEAFRSAPEDLRRAAASLGLSRTTTLFRLLLPSAAPGLAAGLVLGIGRALAETAALIYTSGMGDRMPDSFLDSGRSLSLHIYYLCFNVAGADRNAWASAFILVALLVVINLVASYLASYRLGRRITQA